MSRVSANRNKPAYLPHPRLESVAYALDYVLIKASIVHSASEAIIDHDLRTTYNENHSTEGLFCYIVGHGRNPKSSSLLPQYQFPNQEVSDLYLDCPVHLLPSVILILCSLLNLPLQYWHQTSDHTHFTGTLPSSPKPSTILIDSNNTHHISHHIPLSRTRFSLVMPIQI